ncbi:MAG: hypothetical protein M3460_15220 [Actinomycetota bacterium]|nr:hypothetical protein [Actinomycetota bacterium]
MVLRISSLDTNNESGTAQIQIVEEATTDPGLFSHIKRFTTLHLTKQHQLVPPNSAATVTNLSAWPDNLQQPIAHVEANQGFLLDWDGPTADVEYTITCDTASLKNPDQLLKPARLQTQWHCEGITRDTTFILGAHRLGQRLTSYHSITVTVTDLTLPSLTAGTLNATTTTAHGAIAGTRTTLTDTLTGGKIEATELTTGNGSIAGGTLRASQLQLNSGDLNTASLSTNNLDLTGDYTTLTIKKLTVTSRLTAPSIRKTGPDGT